MLSMLQIGVLAGTVASTTPPNFFRPPTHAGLISVRYLYAQVMLPSRYIRVVAAARPAVGSLCICFASSLSRHTLHRPSLITRPQKRGKKTKSTITLGDPPQGVIALDPLPLEDELPAYPTVVHQARSHMQKFENCVLLTRVGGFYELYFEHADEFGPLLNLKVTQKRVNGGRTLSMVRFLPVLVTSSLTDD